MIVTSPDSSIVQTQLQRNDKRHRANGIQNGSMTDLVETLIPFESNTKLFPEGRLSGDLRPPWLACALCLLRIFIYLWAQYDETMLLDEPIEPK